MRKVLFIVFLFACQLIVAKELKVVIRTTIRTNTGHTEAKIEESGSGDEKIITLVPGIGVNYVTFIYEKDITKGTSPII